MPEGQEGQNGPSNAPEVKRPLEARDNREKVVDAFHSAFSLLDNTPDEQLTDDERWAKNSIKSAKEKTLDQGKSTFTNTFENLETGEVYTQEEGIPVESLLDFMRKKLANLPPNSHEWQDIVNRGHVLYRNSQFFSKLPHRMQPERLLARNRQEANLISKDTRATGAMDGDWYKAEAMLNKRIELMIPPSSELPSEPVQAEQPEETSSEEVPPVGSQETTGEMTPGPEPAPEPTPEEPEPQPQPVEDIRREFVIINRTVDIRKRAAELAEEQLRNEMRRGSGWNPLNWPRKVALRVAEQFYRQRFIERATREMLANNNSYLDMDVVKNAVRDANANISQERQAGKEKVEQVKTGEQMAGQRVVEAQGQLKTMLLDEVLRPAVDGTITNQAQIQERLRQFVQTHENDPDVQAVFGRDATQYGRLAEYFASDLLEMGDLVKRDLAAHHYALEQLDQHVSIKLANTSWAAETQAQFNATDRAVAWAQSRRLTGWLINPATIGAASSLASFGILRVAGVTGTAAQVITPGVGTLFGAGVAAFRRNYDLKVDRAAHQVERAYGRQVPSTGAPRREALERFTYNTASVNELLQGGGQELLTGTNRRSLAELLRQDLSDGQTTNREAVVRRIAEIKSRLDFSASEKVDLVTFQAREQVEQGRLGLIKAVVEARQATRNAGMGDAEITQLETRFTGEWNTRFTQNREQQDRNFAHFRLRNALGAGVFGGAVGLGSGLLVQEGLAMGGRATGQAVGQTVIEKGLGALGIHVGETAPTIPTPSGIAETLKNLYQQGGSADVGNLQAHVGPDHAVSIIDKVTGQPVPDVPKIVLGADGHMNATGAIPQNLRDELQNAGFQIDQGPDITEPGQTIIEQRPVLGPDGEWTKHSTNVHHREWYSYDQPGSQGNELRFYTRQDGQAVILDINNMKLGYQRGLVPNPIDGQQVIKNHEAMWYFTTPNLPQDGIKVSDGADGLWDGKLRLDPNADPSLTIDPNDPNSMKLSEFSKMVLNQEALKIPPGGNAIEVHSRQDVFNLGQDGKFGFIEAGRIQPRAEGNVLQTFATIRGASPVPEFVEMPKIITPEPISTFEIIPPVTEAAPPPEVFEAPPIIPIPFAPRHPLERLSPPIGRFEGPVYYGAYAPYEGLPQEAREFYRNRSSESLRNNPNATLNVEREINDYLARQSPEYQQQLQNYLNQEGMVTPMENECEAAVCIPVYTLGEGQVVKNALEQYLLQIDSTRNKQAVDPKRFELILFLNHPRPQREEIEQRLGQAIQEGAEERVRAGRPEPWDTEEVIRQFQLEHPELRIRVMKEELPERPQWGKIIKPLYDAALGRAAQRSETVSPDISIVTNDIDVVTLDPSYMRDIVSTMKRHPDLDGVVGKIDMPNHGYENYPGFLATMRLYQFLDAQIRRRQERVVITQGRSSIIRGSVYAAIGGANPNTDAGADTELGRMVAYARNNPKTIAYLNKAWLHTDPRRELDMWKAGTPLPFAWDRWAAMDVYGGKWDSRFNVPPQEPSRIDKDFLEREIYFEMERWGLNPTSKELVRGLGYLGLKPTDYHVGRRPMRRPRGEDIEVNTIIIDRLDGVVDNLKNFIEERRWEKTEKRIAQTLKSPPRQEGLSARLGNRLSRIQNRMTSVLANMQNAPVGTQRRLARQMERLAAELNTLIPAVKVPKIGRPKRQPPVTAHPTRPPETTQAEMPTMPPSPPSVEQMVARAELPPPTETLEATMPGPEASLVSGIGFSEDANLSVERGRLAMEDAHTVVENFGGKPNQSFFAIYDGHGGREVADFVATRLHENLLRFLQAGASPTVALKTAYQTTDDQITIEKIKQNAGATAVTALIQGNKLYIANAGDARAVLDRGGQAMRLTYDHKATDAAERARIEALGGRVEDGYVQRQLAVARALGDRYLRPYVITEPQQSEIDLTPQDQTLILACDGVWDVMTDQEAVDLIKNEPDPQKASDILKNEALRRGSTDNISVLVIGLKLPETTPSEAPAPEEEIPPPPMPRQRPLTP